MRWLKHLISLGLLIAAVAVALAVGLSDHSADYGKVSIPPGGTVHLPDGKVIVYFRQPGDATDPNTPMSIQLTFQVTSASGVPVPITNDNGAGSVNIDSVQRSEKIGQLGSVAKLHVPASGDYVVSGNVGAAAEGASLEFGTNAGAALLAKWHLLAGLLLGAFLVALIPVPKHRRRWEDQAGPPRGWSSDPRAPYAG
jgi:hypothetical protein